MAIMRLQLRLPSRSTPPLPSKARHNTTSFSLTTLYTAYTYCPGFSILVIPVSTLAVVVWRNLGHIGAWFAPDCFFFLGVEVCGFPLACLDYMVLLSRLEYCCREAPT